MSKPVLLERDFHLGIRNDVPRSSLPPGAAWLLQDVLIHRDECPAMCRGPWTYNSASLTVGKTARTVSFAPLSTGAKVVAIDTAASNNLWYASPSASTGVSYTNATGTVPVPISKPFQHRDYHIIPYDGTTDVKSFNGTAIAAIATAPNAYYGCLWKDYSILAGTAAQPQRLYFSDPGDPTTWDTTNSYWDFPFPIKGVVSLPSCLMVWGSSQVWRLRGSVPPALTGAPTDLVMERVGDVGLLDARTISVYQDSAIWAAGKSLYMSDGTQPIDLGAAAGLGNDWALGTTFLGTGVMSADVYLNRWYVISAINYMIVYELPLRRWTVWGMQGVRSVCRIPATGTVNEQLLFGYDSGPRVGNLTPCFAPIYDYAVTDANGDTASFVIWTRMYGLDGKRRIRRVYVHYETSGTAGNTLSLTADLSPKSAAGAVSLGTLPTSSDSVRGRKQLKRAAATLGVNLSGSRVGGVYEIWADGHDQEGSKL